MNTIEAFENLEKSVYSALETYANVHRGSGHNSIVTTRLYEKARDIVIEYLDLDKSNYVVIFNTPSRAFHLKQQLKPDSFYSLSCDDTGLSLGVTALVVKKNFIPKGTPPQTGGGTTRLVNPDWIVWAKTPDKFEAGTPAIINVIAFAKALLLVKKYGRDIFRNSVSEKQTAEEILFSDEFAHQSGQELLNNLRELLIGKNILVPTAKGMVPYVNLDNSASTPTFVPVWNAFRQTLRQSESVQSEIIQSVKTVCAEFLNAPLSEYDMIFTSNTTEAINLASDCFFREFKPDTGNIVVSSLLEHSSNDLPWRTDSPSSLIRLSIDKDGFIDLLQLKTLLIEYNQEKKHDNKRIRLVAISGVSNVLGAYNNLAAISNIVHRYDARLLIDGAQLAAHRKIDMNNCGIDYLAFSAHKIYAPFGCGVLLAKKGLLQFSSGEEELIKSSAEYNAAGIAALGKSLLLLQRIGMDIIQNEEQTLTQYMLRELLKVNGIRIHGISNPDSPEIINKGGVIAFSLKNKMPDKLTKTLAERAGIGMRSGCHCAHILVKHILGVGPKLQKFQRVIVTLFPKLNLPGVARVSLGMMNTKTEVDIFINELNNISDSVNTGNQAQNIKQLIKEFTDNTSVKVYAFDI